MLGVVWLCNTFFKHSMYGLTTDSDYASVEFHTNHHLHSLTMRFHESVSHCSKDELITMEISHAP